MLLFQDKPTAIDILDIFSLMVMTMTCTSTHLLLPYNYHYSRKLIYVPASAGIYCFLITSRSCGFNSILPASAGIYCFLITEYSNAPIEFEPASAGIYCFLITVFFTISMKVRLHQQAFIASL